MVFSSEFFLCISLPGALLGYFALSFSRTMQNLFLLAVSLFFYAWGEPYAIFLMLFSICANYVLALLLVRKWKIFWFVVALFANLMPLAIFKYSFFIISNINKLFSLTLPEPRLALPIGISFFTFQALSYVIDVYRGKVEPQSSVFKLGLYISFFPQLVAGPIVRYTDIEKQINNRRYVSGDFIYGCRRFAVGLAKKVLLADHLAEIADFSFDPVNPLSVSILWLGAIAYAFQIYFDFSGYSDMAIGLGRMFGFKFGENFRNPYGATSISDFWRRWHISLGSWFRDYVYIPLGGNRVRRIRLVFNLLVVWSLTGLWHGANWTFVMWGLGYFVLIAFEKVFANFSIPPFLRLLARPYALLSVLLLWVLFRSSDIAAAVGYLKGMLCMSGFPVFDDMALCQLRSGWAWLALATTICIVSPRSEGLYHLGGGYCKIVLRELFFIVLFLLSIAAVVNSSYSPFIYFNF